MKYSIDFPNGLNLYSIDSLNNTNSYNNNNFYFNNNLISNTDSELYGNFKNNYINQSDIQSMSNITSYTHMGNDQSLGGMDSNKLRWNQPPLNTSNTYQPHDQTNNQTSTSENSTCNNSPVSQSTSYLGNNQNLNQSSSSSPNVSSNNILNSISNNSSSSSSSLVMNNNSLPTNSPNVLSAPNKKRQRDDEINNTPNTNTFIDPFALRDDNKDFNQQNLDNTFLQQQPQQTTNINDNKEINIKIKKDNTNTPSSTNINKNTSSPSNNTAATTSGASGNLKLPSIHHLEFEVDRNAKKDDSSGNSSTTSNTSPTSSNTTTTNQTNNVNSQSTTNNITSQSSSSPNNQKKRKTKPSKYSITPTSSLTPTSSSTSSSIGASPINSSSNIPFTIQNTLSSNSLQSYMNPTTTATDYTSMVSTYHSPTSSSTTSSSVTSPLINQYGTNPNPTHPLNNQFYSSLTGTQTNDTSSYFQSPVILSPFQKSHTPAPLTSYGSSGDLNDYMSLNSGYYGNAGSGMNTPQNMGHSPSHNDYSSTTNTMNAKNQYDPTSSLSLLSSMGDNSGLNKGHTTNYYSTLPTTTTPSTTQQTQSTLTTNNTPTKLQTTTSHIKYEPSSSTNYHDQISQSHLYQNNFTYYDQSFPHPPVKKTHRRRPANIDKSTLYCHNCGTKNTPEWRRGPSGPATLCNACGLAYAKKQREEETNLHKLLLHSNSYSYHRGNMLESYVTPSLLPLFNTAASVPYMSTSQNNQNTQTGSANTTPQTAYTNSYNIPNTTNTNQYTNSSFKPLTFSSLKTPNNDRNTNTR